MAEVVTRDRVLKYFKMEYSIQGDGREYGILGTTKEELDRVARSPHINHTRGLLNVSWLKWLSSAKTSCSGR